MGDQEGQIIQTDEALRRIVAMLLALAALAERVSSLSHPVRCLVLWILRPAEAAAREFATEITHVFAEHAATVGNGDSPADAMRIASQFRLIAQALDDLTRKALRFAQACRSRLENSLGGDPYGKILRSLRGFAEPFAPARSTVFCTLERRDSS